MGDALKPGLVAGVFCGVGLVEDVGLTVGCALAVAVAAAVITEVVSPSQPLSSSENAESAMTHAVLVAAGIAALTAELIVLIFIVPHSLRTQLHRGQPDHNFLIHVLAACFVPAVSARRSIHRLGRP